MHYFTRYMVIPFFLVFALTSCKDVFGPSGTGSVNRSLAVDQVSSVPLIDNQTSSLYVYITNTGSSNLSNVEWTLENISSPQKSSNILTQVKSLFTKASNDTNSTVIIKDSSECNNVLTGQSCRILLQANQPGMAILHAQMNDHKINLFGGAGLIQVDNYTPINTGYLADVLSVTPLSDISYRDVMGSGSFFIINNGANPVQLDITQLSANLPANVSLSLGFCPNPIPSGDACQVRVAVNNLTKDSGQELTLPFNLSGTVINSDGSTSILPKQNGNTVIMATSQNKAVIQYIFSRHVIIDNSFANLNTLKVSGIISNSGTNSLIVSKLSSNNNILNIINDTCSGKSLGQGEMCNYTVNFNVSQMNSSGNGLVTINYIDQPGGATKSVDSHISWTYIPPLPEANASISMAINSNQLTQVNPITSLVINNVGNVALSNLSTPTMNPANPRIVISNSTTNPCSGTLDVGATCSYTVTYVPQAPSEMTSVVFGNISASHLDNRGSTVSSSFNNSVAVNVTSIFAGAITSSSVVSLNESKTSNNVVFTNTGNHLATIANIIFESGSSSNLTLMNDTCVGIALNPGQSCNVMVGLINSSVAGSGSGVLDVIYNNHNDITQASSSNSNIDWLIGHAPSLQVLLAQNSLLTIVGVESVTTITLKNNGRNNFSQLILPSVSMPLSLSAGINNGCMANQDLAVGESCSLLLHYNPIVTHTTRVESIGVFGAKYIDGNNIVQDYITNISSITLTAIAVSDLRLNVSSISQSVNWANPTQTSEIGISNIGETSATITSITSDDGQVTTSGCLVSLNSSDSCSLIITGNYNSSELSRTIDTTITINYVDSAGSKSKILNVTAGFAAMPVVTPNVTISSSLFGSNVSLAVNELKSYAVMLSNNTVATNNGDSNIYIPYASLLPSNTSGISYSINTDGITNNACSLPSTGGVMSLPTNTSCNYHLVINAGNSDVTSSSQELLTSYNYSSYNAGSSTPSEVTVSGLNNSFNLTVTSYAQLSIEAVSEQINNFNNVEQGLANPSMSFKLTNTGTGAVAGNVSANLPSGITITGLDSCANLGANNSCNVTLNMSTAAVIVGNLNINSLNYNNRTVATIANFPSVNYSIVTPDKPLINMVALVSGCAVGNGVTSTCYNNPDNVGGSASQMKIRLTFTNTSTTTSASNVVLPSDSELYLTSSGYILSSNTCNSSVAINGGSCYMEYSLPERASSGTFAPLINVSDFNVNYSYITAQGQSLSGSTINSLKVDMFVRNPFVSISAIASVYAGESAPVVVTISNLYQSGTPTVVLSVESGDGSTPSTITTSSAICSSISNNGSICNGSIQTTTNTVVNSGYKLIANMNTLSSSRTFVLKSVGWQRVGIANFSVGGAYPITMAFNKSTNEPYVAYITAGNLIVQKYNGSSWINVGTTPSVYIAYPSLAFGPATNQPYVAYSDGGNSSKATVIRFDGESWITVGMAGFSQHGLNYISLAFSPTTNQPYVAVDGLTVMKYDGESWVAVGNSNFSAGETRSASLAFNLLGEPYVAYKDFANGGKMTVIKYNGSSWGSVGSPGFSKGVVTLKYDTVPNLELAFNPITDEPYVAYADLANENKTTIVKYTGGSWNSVGESSGVSMGAAYGISLAFNPVTNEPYVAYQDEGNGKKGSVKLFNGSSWESVGSTSLTSVIDEHTSLVFSPLTNEPYLAFPLGTGGYWANVMRFGK